MGEVFLNYIMDTTPTIQLTKINKRISYKLKLAMYLIDAAYIGAYVHYKGYTPVQVDHLGVKYAVVLDSNNNVQLRCNGGLTSPLQLVQLYADSKYTNPKKLN